MPDQPNFLLIMSDQHHPRVMGCAGDPLVRTPHLDALAASGVRFTSAYCGSPLCVPSRMTFMTSRHCSDLDVYTNGCVLASDIPTFAHSLGATGYEVVLGGRMHFVGPDQRHGFGRRLIGDISGRDGVNLGNIPVVSTGQSRETVQIAGPGRTGYQAYDAAVLEACQGYLREAGCKARGPRSPFCLVAGFLMPHCPFIAPKPLYEYYRERIDLPRMPDGYLEQQHPAVRELRQRRGFDQLTADETLNARAAYYGMVEYFDGIVGQLLDTLRAAGLAEDTVVIYCSDHGDCIGEHGLWCKTTMYEGSVGVPLIVSAPGMIPGGGVAGANASLLDLGPTMLDYAGAAPLEGVAGRSLRPVMEGDVPPGSDDTVMAEMIGYGLSPQEPPEPAMRMIKQGPCKLVHYEGFEPQLFNLDDDPGEFVDLAGEAQQGALRDQLHARVLAGWDPERALQVIEAKRQVPWPAVDRTRPDPEQWHIPDSANIWPET